jgi:hypothetical protein
MFKRKKIYQVGERHFLKNTKKYVNESLDEPLIIYSKGIPQFVLKRISYKDFVYKDSLFDNKEKNKCKS